MNHFLALARFGLKSVSRVIVFTPGEVEQYQRTLSLAPEAITYCPHGWYDALEYYDPAVRRQSHALDKSGRYVFASGRSYRDYATLSRAVEGTGVDVRISGRSFNVAGTQMPPNVQTTGWLDYRMFQNYLYESTFTPCRCNQSPMPAATAAS